MTDGQGQAYSVAVSEAFIKVLVAFILGLVFSAPCWAGAWNQPAGQGQVIITASWSQGDEIFDQDFKPVSLDGFTKFETRYYIEQGVTDWLTLVGNTGLQTLSFQDDDSFFEFDGFDDIELGAQIKTYARSNLATSIRVSYVIDSRLDNQVVDVLSGGDVFEARALIGQSRETLIGDFFYDAQFALRTKSFGKVDGTQAALTFGYRPKETWLFMSQSFLNRTERDQVDGFRVPAQTQINSQLSVARQYRPRHYFQIGVNQSLLGQSIVKESGVFIGLWSGY